jgi:hypothetical protein
LQLLHDVANVITESWNSHMAIVECHFCERRIDDSEAVWVRPFAGAQRVAGDNIDTFAGVSRQPVDGGVPCCLTCLDDFNVTPRQGHTLVIEKSGGGADVSKMSADGVWEPVRNDTADVHTAWTIARSNLEQGCSVWFRHESEPDSAIRPYR